MRKIQILLGLVALLIHLMSRGGMAVIKYATLVSVGCLSFVLLLFCLPKK